MFSCYYRWRLFVDLVLGGPADRWDESGVVWRQGVDAEASTRTRGSNNDNGHPSSSISTPFITCNCKASKPNGTWLSITLLITGNDGVHSHKVRSFSFSSYYLILIISPQVDAANSYRPHHQNRHTTFRSSNTRWGLIQGWRK